MPASPLRRLSGQIVDVHARRTYPGTVEWRAGRITRLVADPAVRERHLILPGFVDAHIHIESSLLPPAEFARLAVVHGTVATVSDPHEIANVLGPRGVVYMIRDGQRTPFKFNFGAPSCVPATTFETAGATLDAAAVSRLLARRDIRYLAEVMNFPGVLAGDPSLRAMIAAAHARGKQIDGHAPGLRGAQAAAYAAAGPTTDHECFTLEEAHDKLAAGMKILIREGSAARNFAALAPLLRTHPDRVMFCCDDLHPDLLIRRHLDEHVRRALATGADRFDVLRCASVNPVEHYDLDVGLLRAGDPADFIVVDNWRSFRVRRTYLRGELVAAAGRSRLPRQPSATPNQFRARARTAADFAVPAAAGTTLNIIEAINGQLISRHLREPARVVAGHAVTDLPRDLLKIAVVNRYTPRAPLAIGFIRGFGLRAGALASSVAHDSHNIVAVGADDASLAAAVNLVIAHRGGLSVVGRGRRAVLPLPIAGLMSDRDGRTVARRYTALDHLAKRLGSKLDAPFMTLSFMALLVIPDLKLSDRGLFSATRWNFVPPTEPL
ncbi:adenine deaminase [Horticoccus luteus]|uniref:Adenine deaminase n=1 Tax=Horticoccus luteus TaxID=2862869 RepID=A0A8F9TWX8_9BACT|nr:adenine deaminase [Horticoccus luteus]QYM79067.1 adenine deaminase [Horticoccus luteus]